MSISKERRNKEVIKLANKVLHIRDQTRHSIKEFEKALYSFAKDYPDKACTVGWIQHKLELGAKLEIDDSLNSLYEYVARTLHPDNN